MTRRDLLAMAFVGAGAVSLTACGTIASTIRYRLTVEVDTPNGLRQGSSVIETSRAALGGMGDASGIQNKVKGEAVAIDLPGGQTMFAILKGGRAGEDYASAIVHDALAYGRVSPLMLQRFEASEWREERKLANQTKPTIMLSKDDYPLLVRFRDIRDPKTVEAVDADNLPASFGLGVRLKRVTLQTTDDPLTHTLRSRLTWLSKYPEPALDPSHGPQDWSLSAVLHHGDFIRES